jgi:hypothetical protein
VFTAIDPIYDPASTQSFLSWFSPAVYIYSSGHILGPPTWQFHKKNEQGRNIRVLSLGNRTVRQATS